MSITLLDRASITMTRSDLYQLLNCALNDELFRYGTHYRVDGVEFIPGTNRVEIEFIETPPPPKPAKDKNDG